MSALRERIVLRDAIRLMLEKALAGSELVKHGGVRFGIMLDMIAAGTPLTMSSAGGGGTAKIKLTPALKRALTSKDPDALTLALVKATYVDEQGEEHVGLTLNKLEKTKELGGQKATKDTASNKNESIISDTVNKAVADTGAPVTVVFGDRKFDGVASAEHVGTQHVKGGEGQSTSKADVILHQENGGEVKISVKMDTAEYYLSGDKQMAPILAPVLDALTGAKPPAPRLKKTADEWELVVGPRNKPVKKNMKFPVDDQTAQKAVFNAPPNDVDIIVRGDLTSPEVKGSVVTWANAKVQDSIADIPDAEQPIGLLRHGSGRYARDDQGHAFKGIRPAVVAKKRANAAIEVPVSKK